MLTCDLVDVLELDERAPDQYVATSMSTSGVVFGGQLLAQALGAAARSVPQMQVKSMHTVFTRGASPEADLGITVDRLHTGRSFASLEVSTSQGERLCTRSIVLLHMPDADLIEYMEPAPDIAPPEQCTPVPTSETNGWEIRVVDDVDINDPEAVGPPELFVWSRFADVPNEAWMQQAMLSYASDGFLIGTAMRPHAGVGQALAHVSISTSVITQSISFHRPFDASEWLLLAHQSPHAGAGRSFGRADVFTRDGVLVAS